MIKEFLFADIHKHAGRSPYQEIATRYPKATDICILKTIYRPLERATWIQFEIIEEYSWPDSPWLFSN